MARKRFTPEQIITMLLERVAAGGMSTAQAFELFIRIVEGAGSRARA